ncbi:hypothetical protein SZ54_1496 [Rhizobium sp. UR51a]|nr:hypothetical protein SZ54_1496 [Rhizobium sp. UR51a]
MPSGGATAVPAEPTVERSGNHSVFKEGDDDCATAVAQQVWRMPQ